jgi:hypothetical protein
METRHGFRRSCCSPITAVTGVVSLKPFTNSSVRISLLPDRSGMARLWASNEAQLSKAKKLASGI